MTTTPFDAEKYVKAAIISVIDAYHTTRLAETPVEKHVLTKPYAAHAFDALVQAAYAAGKRDAVQLSPEDVKVLHAVTDHLSTFGCYYESHVEKHFERFPELRKKLSAMLNAAPDTEAG